jgi:hypothetical protein
MKSTTKIRIGADVYAIRSLGRAVSAVNSVKLVVVLTQAGRVTDIVCRIDALSYCSTLRPAFLRFQ